MTADEFSAMRGGTGGALGLISTAVIFGLMAVGLVLMKVFMDRNDAS